MIKYILTFCFLSCSTIAQITQINVDMPTSYDVEVADFDGDHKPDIFIPRSDWQITDSGRIFYGNGKVGTLPVYPNAALATCTSGIVINYNKDLFPDIVVTDSHGTMVFYKNTGTKFVYDKKFKISKKPLISYKTRLVSNDINQDGYSDILCSLVVAKGIGREWLASSSIIWGPYYSGPSELAGIPIANFQILKTENYTEVFGIDDNRKNLIKVKAIKGTKSFHVPIVYRLPFEVDRILIKKDILYLIDKSYLYKYRWSNGLHYIKKVRYNEKVYLDFPLRIMGESSLNNDSEDEVIISVFTDNNEIALYYYVNMMLVNTVIIPQKEFWNEDRYDYPECMSLEDITGDGSLDLVMRPTKRTWNDTIAKVEYISHRIKKDPKLIKTGNGNLTIRIVGDASQKENEESKYRVYISGVEDSYLIFTYGFEPRPINILGVNFGMVPFMPYCQYVYVNNYIDFVTWPKSKIILEHPKGPKLFFQAISFKKGINFLNLEVSDTLVVPLTISNFYDF